MKEDQAGNQNKPSIVPHCGGRIIFANSEEALRNILGGIGRAVIITKAKSVGFLTSLGFQVIENDEQYAVLESK